MANPIQFWLKDRNSKYMRLPVNPSEVSITSPFGVNKVNIASLGEVSIPGERELKEVSFSSFFPRDYNPTYCEYNNFPSPKEWVRQIEEWRDTRQNIRLIISGTDVSIPVLIPSFDIQPERAGHVGDIYYSLSLTQFRPPVIRKLQDKNGAKTASSNKRPTQQTSKDKTYVVKKGDTLWAIAKSFYGDGSKHPTIYNANKAVIGKNPNLIIPGQKLVIP